MPKFPLFFFLGSIIAITPGCLKHSTIALYSEEMLPQLATIRAYASVKITQDQDTHTFSQFIFAAYPNNLRLETLSFFGKTLSTLTTTSNSDLTYIDFSAHKAYVGPPNGPTIQALLPIAIMPDLLVKLLLLRFNDIPPKESTRSIRKNTLIVTLHHSPPTTVTYSKFLFLETHLFPHAIVLSTPKRSQTIALSYKTIHTNLDLDRSLFKSDIPANFEVIRYAK